MGAKKGALRPLRPAMLPHSQRKRRTKPPCNPRRPARRSRRRGAVLSHPIVRQAPDLLLVHSAMEAHPLFILPVYHKSGGKTRQNQQTAIVFSPCFSASFLRMVKAFSAAAPARSCFFCIICHMSAAGFPCRPAGHFSNFIPGLRSTAFLFRRTVVYCLSVRSLVQGGPPCPPNSPPSSTHSRP